MLRGQNPMLLFELMYQNAAGLVTKDRVQVPGLCFPTIDSLTPNLGVLGLHVLVRWFDRLQTCPKG